MVSVVPASSFVASTDGNDGVGREAPASAVPRALLLLLIGLGSLIAVGWLSGVLIVHVVNGPVMSRFDVPIRDVLAWHDQHALRRVAQTVTLAGADRVVLPLVIAVGMVWRWRRRSWLGLLVMLTAYLGGALITLLVKLTVQRPGPTGGGSGLTLAYPSGHTMSTTVVYGTLALLVASVSGRRVRVFAVMGAAALIVAVGTSVMYLRWHWLTDVAAAIALGVIWNWIIGEVIVHPAGTRPTQAASRALAGSHSSRASWAP